ncbi:MAG TPA: glycosyltransferase [Gemmatimonadaceae bacterium]|nr:glycosyltransferase [Gemmatimonadaceae bacterium]
MKLVVFGLTMSSSWGNGHATLWRALCRSLARRGHNVVFFERDVPYYAVHRDLLAMDGVELVLYADWHTVLQQARTELGSADVGMVTSYCPDGVLATDVVLASSALTVFYDLDTPVTLDVLKSGREVPYLGPRGLRDFDLVLSFTGGRALEELQSVLGAQRVAPLYGHVDPDAHRPAPHMPQYEADLSYLGTYAADRQPAVEALFVEPARRAPHRRFVIGGAQYPESFPWAPNIFFVRHLPPAEHPSFFSSSALTLNVTRRAMADMGYCPSGRLFEAAACGVPMLSDAWEGLETFFTPGDEILVTRGAEDTLAALELPREELARIAAAGRERTLAEHTADRRAQELERALDDAFAGREAAPALPFGWSATAASDQRSVEL